MQVPFPLQLLLRAPPQPHREANRRPPRVCHRRLSQAANLNSNSHQDRNIPHNSSSTEQHRIPIAWQGPLMLVLLLWATRDHRLPQEEAGTAAPLPAHTVGPKIFMREVRLAVEWGEECLLLSTTDPLLPLDPTAVPHRQ